MAESESKAPLFRYSRGRVSAAVFEQQNSGEREGSWLSVQVETRYKDQSGAWRSSSNYRVADLSHLAHVVDVVDRWLVQHEIKAQARGGSHA